MLPCSWKEAFGVECPGCGAQRSFLHLMQGDLSESIVQFPALIPILFLVAYSILHVWKPMRFPAKVIVVSVLIVGVLLFGNWIVKWFA